MAWYVQGWGTILCILNLVLSSHCPWQRKQLNELVFLLNSLKKHSSCWPLHYVQSQMRVPADALDYCFSCVDWDGVEPWRTGHLCSPLGWEGLSAPFCQWWIQSSFIQMTFSPSDPTDINNDTRRAAQVCVHFLRTEPFDSMWKFWMDIWTPKSIKQGNL